MWDELNPNEMIVAVDDPANLEISEDIEYLTGCRAKLMMAEKSLILKKIDEFFPAGSDKND